MRLLLALFERPLVIAICEGTERREEEASTYVLKTGALVILQQAVSPAEMPLAEGAVSNDCLRSFPALLGAAASLLSSHDGYRRIGVVC